MGSVLAFGSPPGPSTCEPTLLNPPVPGHRLRGHSWAANDRDHLADWPLLDEVFAPCNSQGHAHGQFRPVDLPRDGRLDFASLLGKGDDVADLEPLDRELDGHAPDCSFGGRSGPWPTGRLVEDAFEP